MGLSTEEVGVPDRQQTSNDRDVLFQWSLEEVLVHGMSTSEELMEVLIANVETD